MREPSTAENLHNARDVTEMKISLSDWRDALEKVEGVPIEEEPPWERGGITVHDAMILTKQGETATRNKLRMMVAGGILTRERYKGTMYYFIKVKP